ncbi:hypothetical protein WDW86_02420 [Bdellovibrionota bacterium FG-2]
MEKSLWLGPFFGCLLLTGCPSLHHSVQTPPEKLYTSHTLELSWSPTDALQLDRLNITFPQGFSALPGENGSTLKLVANLDLQKEGAEELIQDFQTQTASLSTLDGKAPWIRFPTPSCNETYDPSGHLTAFHGLCLRTFTLIVPPEYFSILHLEWLGNAHIQGITPKELSLVIPPQGTTRILKVMSAISLTGGGREANVIGDELDTRSDLGGRFAADLTAVANLMLGHIQGNVILNVRQSENSRVVVDGKRILKFPCLLPDGGCW